MKTNQQRVVIVDGHPLLKAGLRAMLAEEPDIEVHIDTGRDGEADHADSCLAPQMLLIDRTLPGMNQTEAVAEVRRRYPDSPVLMIMPHETEDLVRASLQTGAIGCIRVDATHEEMRVAIRSVLQGNSYLGMDVSGKAVKPLPGGRSSGAGGEPDALTQRERDVLKLVATGRSSKHIAEFLSLSVKTVGKHRANLMAKLDLHNAAGLTAYAIERGLLY
jgi:DNA-binding NarL/FixJ family response regulator